jgi:hypothetical protein
VLLLLLPWLLITVGGPSYDLGAAFMSFQLHEASTPYDPWRA